MPPNTWVPYCGSAPLPAELMLRWNVDGVVLTLAACAAAAFLVLRRRRGFQPVRYAAAMAALVVIFVSPLCALSSALFSARVVHHLILILVAAPLIAGAMPKTLPAKGGVILWALVQALLVWVWHTPAAYEAALSHPAVYWLMQATLGAAAVGFWSAVRRSTTPAAVSALILAMLPMGLLGAVLTLSPVAFYAPHVFTTAAWGLSPAEDQQLGGLIMWAPAAGVYLAAALAIFHRTLRAEGRPA